MNEEEQKAYKRGLLIGWIAVIVSIVLVCVLGTVVLGLFF